MNIKLMNKIAKIGTERFDDRFAVSEDVNNPDAIMVRSASLHDMKFNDNLLAIARAGAGVNNIPLDDCAKQGIVVFNTPGANANGVKELTVAALMLASRDIVGGIDWIKNQKDCEMGVAKAVEKGKSKFAGCEILGKTLGVIGLGAIGGMVANTARTLGMKVLGCDPYITVHAAWSLSSSVEQAQNYEEIYEKADYITLHVPSTPTTKGMINKETISKMKEGVKILNLARADLVDADALEEGLKSGKIAKYITDFPTEKILTLPNTVAIPHLGASTEESEDNCAVMAADELKEYLTTGNISNSVNYPSVSIPANGAFRICICHLNIANMLSQITSLISSSGLNIENLSNGSKGNYAYTILETAVAAKEDLVNKIRQIDGVIRVRTIK